MTSVAVISTEPASLVAVNDQCAKVEAWAERCESIPELQDANNKLAAIDDYLNRTSTEGRSRVAAAMRRLEVRIGKLLPPPPTPAESAHRKGDTTITPLPLTRQQRQAFRAMADQEDVVEAVIAESSDEAPASRRKVLQAVRGDKPIGDPSAPRTARVNVDARATEVREMARKGFTSTQIGHRLNLSQSRVKVIASVGGFEIPADVAMGRTRNKKFDADRIVATLVHDLEGARLALDLLDYSALDADRIEGWVDSLTESIRVLQKLKTNLVKESTREER